ncbi:uncharacterized protein LOC130049710 [Ostrea edulis]|uniref:uncharacterized protein LOC130049710 n=1 Tax=Ostrea edulis TaxID=37623 RepID=UPI0024AF6CEF|nr:uncharacterized protein LOC130049710 [Ostrea edulis]
MTGVPCHQLLKKTISNGYLNLVGGAGGSERAGNRIEYQDFVSYLEIDPEMQKHPQNIFMTTDTPTNVKITTSKTPEDQFTRFNSSITIRYPDFGTNVSSELKAIRIRSTENITVAVSAHHDITTLIPTEKLSTSYIVSPPSPDRRFQTVDAMTITALQDNTSIVLSESGFSVITNYTLDALETRIHRNADVLAYNIQSSKPVAVFCGMYCMSDVNCSNMIEQIPPSNQLDTIYIVPPNIDMLRTSATIITEKNTFITVRGITIPYGPGRRTRLSITDNVLVLRSVDPILVTSQAFHKDASVGSPYLTVVPGVNQYLPWYKVVVPSGWNTNYIAVMMRKSAVSGLRANKQPIKANTIRFEKNIAIEDLEYSVIIAEIAEGELTLDTIDNTPFGLMVYGNRAGAGYGFAGNVVLR